MQLDITPLVIAQVRAEWKTYDLPGDVLFVQPRDQTLAGAPTRFAVDGAATRALPARTILGHAVALQLTTVAYVWSFGDGSSSRTTTGDAAPVVVHRYGLAGPLSAHVETEYAATFTLDGGAERYPLDGTGVGVGPGQPLTVREARTQLEQG